ncbi:MAG: Uncharacterised protein [Opitutia bacterium UBA7350]|nr:MAG: Uncharacterised protein [Opitutae bacterium UBA7350]
MKKAGASGDKQGAIYYLRLWQMLLLRALVGLISVWTYSLRVIISPESHRYLKELKKQPGIVLLWHNRLFISLYIMRRYELSGHTAALVSASEDGAWMGAILELFGLEPVRGSRNRRGREALRELVATRRAGKSIFITPDGSKGPVYVMKPGAALLARQTDSVVYLLSINFSRFWRLRTWDRFILPHPFSKVEIQMEAITPEVMAATDGIKAATKLLEQSLNNLTEDSGQ